MKKYKQSRVLISILLVILGVVGIGWFTWYFGKIFVGLVSTGVQKLPEKVEKTSSEVLTLPELNLWVCQVGVYKDKERTDLLLERLKKSNWKGQIMKNDPYTIAIGAFNDKETANLLANILLEDGLETWIKEETFPALHYKISGNSGEKITLILRVANALLSGMDIEEMKQVMLDSGVIFSVGECPADFQSLHDMTQRILNKAYAQGQGDWAYRQDLLELFVEYKAFTTNTFKNYKE